VEGYSPSIARYLLANRPIPAGIAIKAVRGSSSSPEAVKHDAVNSPPPGDQQPDALGARHSGKIVREPPGISFFV
jgi:hypothetical protein